MTCRTSQQLQRMVDLTVGLKSYGVILGAFMAFLSVTGNLLVVVAIYRTTSLQNITNYFLASLAVADFAVGIATLPVCLAWFSIDSETLRMLTAVLYMQSLTASTYNLCAVTIDRYIAVRWPLRYHSIMTMKRFWFMVSFAWIFSILTGSVRFFIAKDLFWLITITIVFVVPFAVISYCYAYMLKEARRQSRDASERTVGEMAARAENHKATVTVAIVVGAYLLFTLPMIVVTIVEATFDLASLCEMEMEIERFSNWFLLLSFCNSPVNPLIYAVRRREFRDALKAVVYRSNTVHGS